MSINPRSRLARLLRAIDTALHPIRSARAYRSRRAAYDLYRPRHAAPEATVLPDALMSDEELAELARVGLRREVAATALAMTGEFVTLDQILTREQAPPVLGHELLDLWDAQHDGERVAA